MVLHAALEKPFGPYNLDDVLDGGAIPQLTSITHFKMKRDGRVTGLDETEFIPRPPDGWDAKIPITASAILEVEDLSWLTQAGKKRLQEDCTGRHPRLELESIYHGKQKVKLRVRFTMSEVPAAFMNGDKHADDELKIQWWSKNSSRNFFERYRALALLIHLKETDPETPVEDRDIKYFIRKYKEMLDDPDPESYLFRASLNEDAPANAPKPGRHRYIPDVEIKVMLGLQADWLLAQALVSAQASKGKFLDIPKWLKFCRKVRAKRRTPEGLGWGPFLQREDESEGPIEDDHWAPSRSRGRLRSAILPIAD
ncbi:uncharacterized protein SCHCODRAFT_02599451 [Schizophyllum commune H4-8]|uniref:Expressed protein n=1 Tax=Schizophyllum commune (strain H4-8 / FGSC 9210) TaxID=578458 RepID=D8PLD6_SCHCM|nr:uncharacterized protein SCHCODRAFT_02599451 [Schizophyllum commune H4-8]KAI5894311.1 hypothetical protein SCHCODRAFT_02599451 [Schizophyllum commune H4-8]